LIQEKDDCGIFMRTIKMGYLCLYSREREMELVEKSDVVVGGGWWWCGVWWCVVGVVVGVPV
jgi:hypothetical protein